MFRQAYVRLAQVFGYCEHGCAVSYAICEFSAQFHVALVILSGIMLAAGFCFVAFKVGERLALGEKLAGLYARKFERDIEEEI